MDGAHDIQKLFCDGIDLMQEVSAVQLQTKSDFDEEWQEVLDYATEFKEKTTATGFKLDLDITLEMNQKAGAAGDLAEKVLGKMD